MMERYCQYGAAYLLAALVGGCYVGGDVCKRGEIFECVGDDGCSGQQVCQEDGSFSACVCEESPGTSGESTLGPQTETGAAVESSGDLPGGTSSGAPGDALKNICSSRCSDECPCDAGEVCEDGVCAPCATIEFKNVQEDKGMDSDCALKSVMYFPQQAGGYLQVPSGGVASVEARAGEPWATTVFCCMVDANGCSGLQESCLGENDAVMACECRAEEVAVDVMGCGRVETAACE